MALVEPIVGLFTLYIAVNFGMLYGKSPPPRNSHILNDALNKAPAFFAAYPHVFAAG